MFGLVRYSRFVRLQRGHMFYVVSLPSGNFAVSTLIAPHLSDIGCIYFAVSTLIAPRLSGIGCSCFPDCGTLPTSLDTVFQSFMIPRALFRSSLLVLQRFKPPQPKTIFSRSHFCHTVP